MRYQNLDRLYDLLWKEYVSITPQAEKIHTLFEKQGWKVINDHIALRTYNDSRVSLDRLARVFIENGYESKGEYEFKEKKLFARHYEHRENPLLPKVFISELLTQRFSPAVQKKVKELVDQVPQATLNKADLAVAGRPWKVSYEDYDLLLKESEYAAWVAAFGFRANHFTVNVNELPKVKDIAELNEFLKKSGFVLNASGGEIKGGEDVYLAQSSTMADAVEVDFSDGRHKIPSCYYEFAKRYPLPNGKLYQGFVEKSADKIFESTDRKK